MTMPVNPWHVSDLACHAGAFVEHAGLARLGDELPLEPDVLLNGRLELLQRSTTLLVHLGHPLAEHRPEPDRDDLDNDDRPVQEPQIDGWPREPGDDRVDQDRRGCYAGDDQGPRPEKGGMEEVRTRR
jgi:hypothetical protein